MAIPVARVHLAMAHAAPCAAVVLPTSPPRPSRADAAGRWDAHKIKRTGSPASSASSNSRADSEERWDAHKTKSAASPASSSSSASNSNKTKTCWISRRRDKGRGASSAERWDAHKKPRAPPADELDDAESSTGSNDVELDMLMPQQPPPARSLYFAGPGFIASPEPSMLPSLLIRVA